MRVRVERRRRGRRKPEVDYVEARGPRKRPGTPRTARGPWGDEGSPAHGEGAASNLRLPWRRKGNGGKGA